MSAATTVPSSMRGMVLTGHGGLEKLEYRRDIPVPTPRHGEVLIQVAACGVNNTDVNTRIGWYGAATGSEPLPDDETGAWSDRITFPRIQGADVVGTVIAAGATANAKLVGRRVLVDPWVRSESHDLAEAGYLGSELDGGFAEFVAVPASNAHAIDSPLTDVALASFPCSYSTAEHMLTRCGLASGQTVLVSGASGGVGVALIQLAKRRGATVIAMTTPSKAARLADLGADHTVDRTAPDLASRATQFGPVDVYADVVGGPHIRELLGVIRRGGHYVVSGAVGGPVVEVDLRTVYLHDLTLHGATVVPRDVFVALVRYIEAGEIVPVVAGVYPLSELGRAQTEFQERRHVGSFVMRITE